MAMGSDRMNFEEESAGSSFPSTNSDGTKSRLVTLPDGTIWLTINASWSGSAWVKDMVGQAASAYRFSADGFSYLTQVGGISTWLTHDWATQTSLDQSGRVTSPGVITAAFCAEFQSSATSGYFGGVVNFPKTFPYTPSSFTWTATYSSGVAGGPNVSVQLPYGIGWYCNFNNGVGDKYIGGYVTIS